MNIKLPLTDDGKNTIAPLMSTVYGAISGESVNIAVTYADYLKSPYCDMIFNILIQL